MSEVEEKLKQMLARLDRTTQEIIKTRGYTQDARSLKMLEEIIREQLLNGHTRRSTRTIR